MANPANPLSAATLLTEGLGVAQSIWGAISGNSADKRLQDLLAKRKAYVTPDEIYKILNATEMAASGDTQTRDYLTGQIDRGFGHALGTAELLGGDPNDLSALFDQKMQGILQVGQQFHASNMEAFGKYLGALNTVAENKAAEWQSEQDILKDQIQAAAGVKGDAFKNIQGGMNTILAGLSADEQRKLYTQYLDSIKTAAPVVDIINVGTNTGGNNSGTATLPTTQNGSPDVLPTGGTGNQQGFINWLRTMGKI